MVNIPLIELYPWLPQLLKAILELQEVMAELRELVRKDEEWCRRHPPTGAFWVYGQPMTEAEVRAYGERLDAIHSPEAAARRRAEEKLVFNAASAAPPPPPAAAAADAVPKLGYMVGVEHEKGERRLSNDEVLAILEEAWRKAGLEPWTLTSGSGAAAAAEAPPAPTVPAAMPIPVPKPPLPAMPIPTPKPAPPPAATKLPGLKPQPHPDAKQSDPEHPWREQPNVALRNYIAAAEQSTTSHPESDGYMSARNTTALGRYQLQRMTALRDIKWIDDHGRWTLEAARHGVRSDADFLHNRQAQETALNLYLGNNERYLRRKNVSLPGSDGTMQTVSPWNLAEQRQPYIDRHGNRITLTPASVAAAAHRQGARETAEYLAWLAANYWNVRGKSFPDEKYGPIAERLQGAQDLPYQSFSSP